MALRFFLFFFLYQCFVIISNAQSVKIRPYVGAKFYFDYVVNDKNALPGFKTNCGGNAIDAGLIIEYTTKNNWSYNFSYAHNAAGTSIAHDYRDIGIFTYGCNARYIAIWQYNFGLNYQAGKKIEFFKIKNKSSANKSSNSKLYARMSLGAGIGFSGFNRTQQRLNDRLSGGIDVSSNNSITVNSRNIYLKTASTGYYVLGKAGLRFYRAAKEKFEVSIVFNQGLRTLYTNTNSEAISTNGNAAVIFPATVATRGTTLGFQFVFPITIWEKRVK